MSKNEIYLINEEKSIFESDLISTKKISNIHREKRVDSVFSKSFNNYPLVKRYCEDNQTFPIDLVEINSPINPYCIRMLNYIKNFPSKKRFVNIINKKEDIERLVMFFQNAGFNIDKL